MTMVDLPIAYDAMPEKAIRDSERRWSPRSRPTRTGDGRCSTFLVLGVEPIVGSTMILRVMAKCKAGEEFSVQRELRLLGKQASTETGVPGRR